MNSDNGNLEGLLQLSEGLGKWKVGLILVRTKNGLIAVLLGGEKTHVGAVAVSIPSLATNHREKEIITTSVFTLPGHMDDKVAVPSAEKIARASAQPVVLVCGIHIDQATKMDIDRLLLNCERIVERAVDACTRTYS